MAMLVVHGIINPDDFILMKFDTGPFIITTDTDVGMQGKQFFEFSLPCIIWKVQYAFLSALAENYKVPHAYCIAENNSCLRKSEEN